MQTMDRKQAEITAWREQVLHELEGGLAPSRRRLIEVAGMIEEVAREQRQLGQYRGLIRDLHRNAIAHELCERAAQALRGLWDMLKRSNDYELSTWYSCDAVNVSDLAEVCTGTVNALITGAKLLVFFRSPADRDAFERRVAAHQKLAIRKITRIPEAEAGS